MKKGVIIVAAGTGERMGKKIPKQFLYLGPYPVLWHAVSAFYHYDNNIRIILVLHPSWISYWKELSANFAAGFPVTITEGGQTRAESVKKGLYKISGTEFVAVHDAARPLIRPDFIDILFHEAFKFGNAVPVLPVKESVRKITKDANYMIDRKDLYFVQTPQVFKTADLLTGFKHPRFAGFTDEASLLEQSGIRIHDVKGDPLNLKITYPEDLKIAESLLNSL